ncbi:unnamed protein product [Heligmosomoides polygyrus]|uniref:C2H2-type domain-containing protein n=1 Tax=Heligmosomoides polygyrus TaxID=6339 RepID=A0A3P8E1P2_HELPZ|nr:unnamed protein product [Heligmosomoides polygyrus]
MRVGPTVTTVDETWKDAIDAITRATRLELGPTKPGRRWVDKQAWLWTDDVREKVREKKRLYHVFIGDKTVDNWRNYREAKKAAKKAVAGAKAAHYADVNEKLETRDGERYLYRLAKARCRQAEDIEKFFGINDENGHPLMDHANCGHTIMRGVANVVPSNVRFVRVGNSLGATRIRVNIVYEGGLQTKLSNLTTAQKWSGGDSPPSIDFEGYEDEVPEWGGIEQEVSTGTACWSKSVGEDEEAFGIRTSRFSTLVNAMIQIGTRALWCHVRRPVYKCPLCDVSSTYHLSNIRVHIRKIHNIADEPICFKDEYENEVNAFLYRCFGDHQIFRRQDPEVVACLNDILNCINDGEYCISSTRVKSSGGSIFNEQPIFAARSQPRNTCRVCFESNVKHLERHVLQHHIKQPMFLCPCCNFSSCYSPTSVKNHIKTRHNMFDPLPLDIRDEYAELIQSVYNQCFVDDTSSLASRIAFKQHS